MPLNSDALLNFVQQEIFDATLPTTIVKKAAEKFGIDVGEHSNDAEIFKNWLDDAKESRLRRRNKLQNPELLTDDVRLIIRTIHEQLARAERAIEARTCNFFNCKLRILSERYAIDGRFNNRGMLKSLVLYDCLHGQRVDLEMDKKLSKLSHTRFKLHFIDEEHFLFVCDGKNVKNEKNNAYSFKREYAIHLVRIHFNELRCEVLDSKFPEQPNDPGYYYTDNRLERVIPDTKSSHRFLFHGIVDQKWGCQFVEVLNGQMTYGEFVPDQINDQNTKNWFLEGNDIYTLEGPNEYEEGKSRFIIGKTTAGTKPTKHTTVCTIENPFHESVKYTALNENSCCYGRTIYEWGWSWTGKNEVLKFDLDQQTVESIKIYDEHVFKCDPFILKTDQILTALSSDMENHQRLWRRILLESPDKLQHLAVAAIRRRTFFSTQAECDQLYEKLPVKWRPFGGASRKAVGDLELSVEQNQDTESRKRKSTRTRAGKSKASKVSRK